MSEAVRAVALAEANKTHQGGGDAAAVVKSAETYLKFLSGGTGTPATRTAAGAEPPATPASNKPAATKPAADPKKAAATAKKAAAEAAAAKAALDKANAESEAEGDDEPQTPTDPFPAEAESVGKVVAALIAADKRQDAINLLKKYKAASVSGLIDKGDDTVAAFVSDGNELLGLGGEPDLES